MILTGGVLLLVLVGSVTPYPYSAHQGLDRQFGYPQSIYHQPLLTLPSISQLYSSLDLPIQQIPAQRAPSQQQRPLQYAPNHQQQQQQAQLSGQRALTSGQSHRQIPIEIPRVPYNGANDKLATTYNQQNDQFYRSQPTPLPLYQATRSEMIPVAHSIAPIPTDRDFLSSLQIVDTNGKTRELREFGLAGSGDHAAEPELERQLKSIFETINRDLASAQFFPLDMNGQTGKQLSAIFGQQAERSELQSDRARQSQDSKTSQPAQRFQYLKPARAQVKMPDAPVRSPAQALREAKKVEVQRPIEQPAQRPEELPRQGKTSAPRVNPSLDEQRIGQQPIVQTEEKQVQEQQVKSIGQQQQTREPEFRGNKEIRQYSQAQKQDQPVPVQQILLPQQSPINTIQEEQKKITDFHNLEADQASVSNRQPVHRETPFGHQEQRQQQQQLLVHDDEPAPLKNVDRDPSLTRDYKSPKQRPIESFAQQNQARKNIALEQRPIQQEQTLVDEPLPEQRPIESGERAAKGQQRFAGWVPIVQPQIKQQFSQNNQFLVPKQQQQTIDLEQTKEELGRFEEQKQLVQQKELAPIVEPQFQQTPENYNDERVATIVRDEGQFNSETKGPLNKLKNSINKFAASAKSKLNSGNFAPNDQTLQQQKEEFSQQREVTVPQEPEVVSQQQEEPLAKVVQEQREEMFEQKKNLDDIGTRVQKQEQVKITQEDEQSTQTQVRAEPVNPVAQRQEQTKNKKVKIPLVNKVQTPIQKLRDQQDKIISKQQQLATQKQRQQPQQQILPSRVTDSKRPRQLKSQQAQILQKEVSVVEEEPQNTKVNEPAAPILSTIRQTPRGPALARQQELIKEQRNEQFEQLEQQKQERDEQINQQQQQIAQQELPQGQVQEESFEQAPQKEENEPRRNEQPQLSGEVVQREEPVQQNRDEISEQKTEFAQLQKEEVGQQQRVESASQARVEVSQESSQEKVEPEHKQPESVQQREEQQQQTNEASQQKDETTQAKTDDNVQQKDDLNQQTENSSQQKEESAQTNLEGQQKEEPLGQAQREEPTQQQEPAQQAQVQEDDRQQQQQQSTSTEQLNQQQETSSQNPDRVVAQEVTQQQTGQQESQQQEGQRQEDGVNQQQLTQQTDKQAEVQVQKQTEESEVKQTSQQESQVTDGPSTQQQSANEPTEEEPAPTTTTQRPPTRPVRLQGSKGWSGRGRVRIAETKREKTQDSIVAQAPKSSQRTVPSRQSLRMRAGSRLRQDNQNGFKSGSAQNDGPKYNGEGYLSAAQLYNTYNPLQFEPERISSLNRATESSSQNTNVNSSPSGEQSY